MLIRQALPLCTGASRLPSAMPARASAMAMAAPAVGTTSLPAGATFAAELQAATKAVRLASHLCQTVQQQLSTSEKADKADDSPVTVADYAAQAVVAWSLSQCPAAAPGGVLSMVAEEDSASLRGAEGAAMLQRITRLINTVLTSSEVAGAQALNVPLTPQQVLELIDMGASQGGPTGRHWVLDPIDGTRGFVGMRQYSVCLGMLQQGVVELGVLGCPNLPQGDVAEDAGGDLAMSRAGQQGVGSLFLAHRGCGAFTAPLYGGDDQLRDLQQVMVRDYEPGSMGAARFMESFESRHSDHTFTAAVAEEAGVAPQALRMDSQVKYGLLSRGAAAVFMRFPPPTYKEKIWDHCAGFVIVEEAGGCVTDAGGHRLDFSRGRFLQLDRGIIAAPPKVHKELLRAVQVVQDSRNIATASAGTDTDAVTVR